MNENLALPSDHPVRKLLFRMRERHESRIFPSPLFADIERGIRRVDMRRNNSSHSVALIDELLPDGSSPQLLGNHRPSSPRSISARRRSPMPRRSTEEGYAFSTWLNNDDAMVLNDGKHQVDARNINDALILLRSEVRQKFDSVMDRFSSVDNVLNRLHSLERVLNVMFATETHRPTPSTAVMTDSGSLLETEPMSRSHSWNQPPAGSVSLIESWKSGLGHIPPIRYLTYDASAERLTTQRDSSLLPNTVPMINIHAETPTSTRSTGSQNTENAID